MRLRQKYYCHTEMKTKTCAANSALFWERTHVVAPGEDGAPLRRDTGARVAVNARPRLIDVPRDDRGTVRLPGGR